LNRLGTGNCTKEAPNIGQAGCRRLDGVWLRGCLVVGFLGFGVGEVRSGFEGSVLVWRVGRAVGRSDNLEGDDDIVFPLFAGELSPLSLP